MSQRSKQPPQTWDTYERGRASSFGSLESVPENESANLLSSSTPTARDWLPAHSHHDGSPVLRRRSSLTKRFDSLRQYGGPNSIDNFAKSLQRAAAFREITPVRRNSITLAGDAEAGPEGGEQSTTGHNRSLLRQQLHDYDMEHGESAIHDEQPGDAALHPPTETSRLLPQESRQTLRSISGSLMPSAYGSVSGTSYGSISSKLTETARARASILIQEQEEASRRAMEEPLDKPKVDIPKHFEEEVLPDGEVIVRTVGESTVPMTIFNSTNTLIGVGILALPLGVRYAGWVLGLSFITLAALATQYTAKLLAKCLDTNTGATTYGDIAFLAFDSWGRNIVEFLFIVELTAANVGLIILFGDSIHSLVPTMNVTEWKVFIAIGLLPLNFVPFKYLSVTSILGIVCCIGAFLIVLVDGLANPHAPGSLREVAKTYAFPEDWKTIPLSLGLFMAPWGGHSVFPAIYKDMRHPQKYARAVRTTFIFTYGLDTAMATIGYLMFGDKVRDEVSSNIITSSQFPRALSIIMVILIAIIPITKIPLSNRPMMDTLNKKFYIDLRQMDPKARLASMQSWKHRSGRAIIGISANFVCLAISILFPDFDSLMALMGSALCFSICVILPVCFYLKIFSREGHGVSNQERALCYVLVVVCTLLAALGTVFAIMPKDKIGLKRFPGVGSDI